MSGTRASRSTLTADARALEGRRLILTRPDAQAGDFEARVTALGGDPLIAPAIAVEPPESWTITDAALRRFGTYDWVAFTSANAVRALVGRADAIGIDRDLLCQARLAVVGPATASAAADALRRPDVVPSVHTAEGLAAESGAWSTSFFVTDVPDRFCKVGGRFLGSAVDSAGRVE